MYSSITKIQLFENQCKGVEAKMTKTKLARIDLRMTPEEKENLKRKASEAHMTVIERLTKSVDSIGGRITN